MFPNLRTRLEESFLPPGASRTARLAVGVRTTGNASNVEIRDATGQAARDALAKLPNPRPTGWVDVDITVQRFGGPRLAPLLFAKDYQ